MQDGYICIDPYQSPPLVAFFLIEGFVSLGSFLGLGGFFFVLSFADFPLGFVVGLVDDAEAFTDLSYGAQ